MAKQLVFKFVELSVVTDETIEEVVNDWVSQDWQLEGIRFVVGEASRRPAMAFISFTQEQDVAVEAVAVEAVAAETETAETETAVADEQVVEAEQVVEGEEE